MLLNGLSVVFMYVFGKGLSADSLSALDVDLNLLAFPLALAALVSLILRFIRARERERQQIKWLTYGAVMMLVLIIGGYFVWQDPNSAADGVTFNLAIMLLPLSIGISILRNQLYDIDRLINRTLVYGLLIVILLLTYLLLVLRRTAPAGRPTRAEQRRCPRSLDSGDCSSLPTIAPSYSGYN